MLDLVGHVAAPVRVFSIGLENKRTNNTNKDPSLDNNAAATSRRPMALEACESCYTTGFSRGNRRSEGQTEAKETWVTSVIQ